jgi:hypothetical protein
MHALTPKPLAGELKAQICKIFGSVLEVSGTYSIMLLPQNESPTKPHLILILLIA